MLGNDDKEINVYLLSGQSDLELTIKKINELKETKGRNIVFTPSHEVIDEHQLLVSNSRHWWGLKSKNGCPCLQGINFGKKVGINLCLQKHHQNTVFYPRKKRENK